MSFEEELSLKSFNGDSKRSETLGDEEYIAVCEAITIKQKYCLDKQRAREVLDECEDWDDTPRRLINYIRERLDL